MSDVFLCPGCEAEFEFYPQFGDHLRECDRVDRRVYGTKDRPGPGTAKLEPGETYESDWVGIDDWEPPRGRIPNREFFDDVDESPSSHPSPPEPPSSSTPPDNADVDQVDERDPASHLRDDDTKARAQAAQVAVNRLPRPIKCSMEGCVFESDWWPAFGQHKMVHHPYWGEGHDRELECRAEARREGANYFPIDVAPLHVDEDGDVVEAPDGEQGDPDGGPNSEFIIDGESNETPKPEDPRPRRDDRHNDLANIDLHRARTVHPDDPNAHSAGHAIHVRLNNRQLELLEQLDAVHGDTLEERAHALIIEGLAKRLKERIPNA